MLAILARAYVDAGGNLKSLAQFFNKGRIMRPNMHKDMTAAADARWYKICKDYLDSNMTRKDFIKKHNLPRHNFQRWCTRYSIRKLDKETIRNKHIDSAVKWLIDDSCRPFSFLWILEHLTDCPEDRAQKIRADLKLFS